MLNSKKSGSENLYPVILSEHLQELQKNKKKHKHILYNALLGVLRRSEIPYTTLNNTTIICSGLMDGIWLRPEQNYCRVFLRKSPYSFNLCVAYDAEILLRKMVIKKIIWLGVYDHLCLHLKKVQP